MRLAELVIGREPRNIERRDLHPTSRARAKVVVQSALYARKVRLVRHWTLCIGLREVEGRVAGQLEGLPELVKLQGLPSCWSYWLFCAIQPRFAPALPDQIQAYLRVPHPKACSATVKVSRIIAPESRPFAKVFLNAAANVADVSKDLERKRVPSCMVHASTAEPPPFEQICSIQTGKARITIEVELYPWCVCDDSIRPACRNSTANVQVVVKEAVARRVRTVVSGLRRPIPGSAAHPHCMLLPGLGCYCELVDLEP